MSLFGLMRRKQRENLQKNKFNTAIKRLEEALVPRDRIYYYQDKSLVTLKQQLEVIDVFIQLIKKQLCFGSNTAFLYSDNIKLEEHDNPIPESVSIQGEKIVFCELIGKKRVSLKNTDVYNVVWNYRKLVKCILNLPKRIFTFDDKNHFSIYYKELDILQVWNGKHSTLSAKIYNKEGSVEADEFSLKHAFKFLKTDGIYWYYNKQKIMKVHNVYFAILFEYHKIKMDYKEKYDNER